MTDLRLLMRDRIRDAFVAWHYERADHPGIPAIHECAVIADEVIHMAASCLEDEDMPASAQKLRREATR